MMAFPVQLHLEGVLKVLLVVEFNILRGTSKKNKRFAKKQIMIALKMVLKQCSFYSFYKLQN